MNHDREQRAPAVAPGEPEAPVSGSEPNPAPAEPDGLTKAAAVQTAEMQDGPQAEADEPCGPDGDDGEPDEVGLEWDLEELTAKAEKADEYLKLAQRTKADFENYRKRATRESAAAQDRGVAKLALELLPAVDSLDRAVVAAEAAHNGGELASGIKLVHAGVIAALARVGIEPFSPEGEPFDPQRHEAVAQLPVEGVESGIVVEVYQRGYRLGETVLRPARVVVAG
jgi:molecular chaperone GrpE